MINPTNPKVSIIIPVYNGEHYLDECLDSVLTQSYSNLEVIIVNDGSTDSTISVCTPYLSDDRCTLFSIQNSGVTAARKFGFEHSQGDFVCFIDADDLIQPLYVENFVEKIKPDSQLICLENEDIFLSVDDFVRRMLLYKAEWRIPEKMYSRKILKDQFFNIPRFLNIGEDLLANISISPQLKQVRFITPCPKGNYIYRINNHSVTHKRKHSFEYEVQFMSFLTKLLKNSDIEAYDELNLMKLRIWRILNYNNVPIHRDSKWARSILINKKQLQKSSTGNWIVLNISNQKLSCILLHILQILRRILNKGDYLN